MHGTLQRNAGSGIFSIALMGMDMGLETRPGTWIDMDRHVVRHMG